MAEALDVLEFQELDGVIDTSSPGKKISLMDMFWSMFNSGILQMDTNPTQKRKAPGLWYSIKYKLVPGSIVEIGACCTSIYGATQLPESTVLAIVQDDVSVKQCKNSPHFSKNMRNFHLGQIKRYEDIENWLEENIVSYPLLLGNMIISKITDMNVGLLPHEYEKLTAKMLSVSQQVFVMDFSLPKGQESYFIDNWERPSELLNKACNVGNLDCKTSILRGSDLWEMERVAIHVQINHCKRELSETFCSQYTRKQCYLEYNIGKAVDIFTDDGRINQTVDSNTLPLDLILQTDPAVTTMENVFSKLLRQVDNEQYDINLVLHGGNINYTSMWVNDRQRSIDDNPYKNFDQSQNIRLNDLSQSLKRKLKPALISPDVMDTIITTEEKQVKMGLEYLTKPFVKSTQIPYRPSYMKKHYAKFKNNFKNFTRDKMKYDTKNLPDRLNHLKEKQLNTRTRVTQVFLMSKNEQDTKELNDKYEKLNLFKENKGIRVNSLEKVEPDSRNTKVPNKLSSILLGKENNGNIHIKDPEIPANNTTKGKLNELGFRKRKLLSISSDRSYSNGFIYNLRKQSKAIPTLNNGFTVKVTTLNTSYQDKLPKNSSPQYVNFDENLFDYNWRKIKKHVFKILPVQNQHNIFVYGRGDHCLLSSKLSLLYPTSDILTTLPADEDTITAKCRRVISSLPQYNNLVFNSNMSPRLINQFYQLPQIFKLQVLGMDIFTNIVQTSQGFLLYLGKLLTNAENTILELPSLHQLEKAIDMLKRTTLGLNLTQLTKGLIHQALHQVQADYYPIKILTNGKDRKYNKTRLILIRLKSFKRKVKIDCSGNTGLLSYQAKSGINIDSSSKQTDRKKYLSTSINLHFLILLKLQAPERAMLYGSYLLLPIVKDMCSLYILWTNKTLYHIYSNNNTILQDYSIQQTKQQLKSEIKDQHFLFLDVNNDNRILTYLASSYINSTFVAMRDRDGENEVLYNTTVYNKTINNIAVTNQILDTDFTDKLLHSPDIFRYQFIGYTEFLRSIGRQMRSEFDSMLGNILSTGVTTFLQVPSAQILSLSAATFYPDIFSHEDQSLHLSEIHPLPPFITAERDLIYESAKADVDIDIKTQIIPDITAQDGIKLPWKLIRVDIKQLKVKVDHHFDFNLDGHQRKYIQHVVSYNKSHYDVHLVRQQDGFKIPYGNVNAISLIALLRMGLIEVQKNDFYAKFLNLPLYEDMAPWNIVFRHGTLEYIDYDTKDYKYDKLTPAAYRILMVLTNYQRTVKDFNHCGMAAKNEYGFKYIAECVGSSFIGPCKDPRYPVPCGDKTCQSTYIDCLRSLQDKTSLHLDKKAFNDLSSRRFFLNEEKPEQWSFNKNGAKTRPP
ncbi:uncharacterized protein LOC126817803 isoform X2 [Patella vulgata]|uniref:uncharacterized protein LOC126817803 isoform X2 n=1 Tax=Patella vulgata TaxID=6465 RepID=UPI00218049ED|nr:uncharacterized protein LOC126817803 isoform X2 [Patella vulgata]